MAYVEVGGQVTQGILGCSGQQHRGQVPGVVGGVDQRHAVGPQEAKVEGNIVTDYRVGADELRQAVSHAREKWSVRHLTRRYAGEALDEFRNRAARIYEGLEGVNALAAPELDRAYLDDLVPVRVQPRGFQVQGNVDLIERVQAGRFHPHVSPIPTSHDGGAPNLASPRHYYSTPIRAFVGPHPPLNGPALDSPRSHSGARYWRQRLALCAARFDRLGMPLVVEVTPALKLPVHRGRTA